jgi:hypothetical protein
VVFLLGFGFHEHLFLKSRKEDSIIIFRIGRPIYWKVSLFGQEILFRDGINPNKNIPSESPVTSGETTRRKRRFLRQKEINRDQNDTVVNLSSVIYIYLNCPVVNALWFFSNVYLYTFALIFLVDCLAL